jgi:PhnB protein
MSKQWSRRQILISATSTGLLRCFPSGASSTNRNQFTKGNKMIHLSTYLLFDGNCLQAMEFYKSCFGGKLSLTKVKDSPVSDRMASIQQNKVINARLKSEAIDLSASDWLRPDQTRVQGNTVCLYVSGTTQDLKAIFTKLSEGADVTEPLTPVFHGIYGALNDRFGIRWMFQAPGQV